MDSDKLIPARRADTHELTPLPAPAGPRLEGGFPLPEEDSSLRYYWAILLKRKWTVILTVVVVVTLVSIASFKMTPRYEALSRIAVGREQQDVLGFRDVATGSNEEWDYTIQLGTQLRVLQSDTLAMRVIEQLQLDKNPVFAPDLPPRRQPATEGFPTGTQELDDRQQAALLSTFRSQLRVTLVPRSRIVEIRCLSPDPQLAAQMANSLVNTYIEYNFKTKFESTMKTSSFLSDQLVELQRKVETSQEKLVDYQREHEILGLDDKQNIITSKLADLNTQLTLSETDRINKQASYELTLSANQELVPGVPDNRIIQRLKEQEAEVKDRLAQASTQFGPFFPKVVELRNQLQQIESALKTEVGKISGRIQNEYLAAVQREKMLRAALENQKQEANRLNERAIQYNILKREVDTNRQLYDGLLQKLKEASVSAGLRSGNISVVDVARVPSRPAKPNIPLNIVLALFASLGLGVVLAFVQENLDNTVRAPQDVEDVSALPSLGLIPIVPNGSAARKNGKPRLTLAASNEPSEPICLISISRPNSEITEAYRALRTSVLLSSLGAPPKVLLVTSGLPKEGKTTTSINLAVVLAQKGGRVLLVDGDLRRPCVHRDLGLSRSNGLTNLLAGGDTLEEVAIPFPPQPNLLVLPAGPSAPYPAELLGSQLMHNYLAKWREQFDHIVIDTAPALTVTDAVLLSSEVDGVLIVIRAGQTTRQSLRRVRDLLRHVNARVVGVVINAVDLRSSGYSYSYGGYYDGSEHGGKYYDDGTSQD